MVYFVDRIHAEDKSKGLFDVSLIQQDNPGLWRHNVHAKMFTLQPSDVESLLQNNRGSGSRRGFHQLLSEKIGYISMVGFYVGRESV